MNPDLNTGSISPGRLTRFLLASSLLWSLVEELFVIIWRAQTFGSSQAFFPYPYTFHLVLAPAWVMGVLFLIIALVTGIWLQRGGLWGILLIFVNSLVAEQSLPIGWGPLASHPAIFLCVIWDLGTPALRRNFIWIFLTQVTFMYVISVTSKDYGFWLKSPGAVLTTLKSEIIATDTGHWLSSIMPPAWGAGVDALILGVQLSAILLWGLRRHQRAWMTVLFGVASFHVISAITLKIIPFVLACLGILSMGLPQKSFRNAGSSAPKLSALLLSIWAFGILAGTFRMWAPGLEDLSLRQSWRIMTWPDQTVPADLSVEKNGTTYSLTGGNPKTVLTQGLAANEKVRAGFLRTLCETRSDRVSFRLRFRDRREKSSELDCSLFLH